MEMKDAPLVQEEIVSSKVSNLRKVAITVAVVALTVCGVAIGMVASGMENKTVPTLKYTPGTKTTYNHHMKIGQGSTGGKVDMDMQVEQFVLSRDAQTGATTFLVKVPVMATPDNSSAPDFEVPAEAKKEPHDIVSFVITQAADGEVNWATAKTDADSTSPVWASAAKMLVHHMEMVAPRLQAESTTTEVDHNTMKMVDAKYAVNNLEQGTTEVVRTVAPAGVHNQVNGPQLAYSSATAHTVKDGEVVSATKTGAHETSIFFEKKGPSTGQINLYKDNRESWNTDSKVAKASTESFDLTAFAEDLAKFEICNVHEFVNTDSYEAQKPHPVGSGIEGVGVNSPRSPKSKTETATVASERSLLWTMTLFDDKWYELTFKIEASMNGGDEVCGTLSGDGQKVNCSNNKSAILEFNMTLTACEKLFRGHASIRKLQSNANTIANYNTSNPSTYKRTKWLVKLYLFEGTIWVMTLTFYDSEENSNQKDYADDMELTASTITIFSYAGLSLNAEIKFVSGRTLEPGVEGYNSKGAGDWGCTRKCEHIVASQTYCFWWGSNYYCYTTSGSSTTVCNDTRTQNLSNTNNIDQGTAASYDALPATNKWGDSDTPELFGVIEVTNSARKYIKVSDGWYKQSGCSQKYSNNRSRFRMMATITQFFEITLDVSIQTFCVGYAKTRIGVRMTGRLLSVAISGTAYLALGNDDCWFMAFAQAGAVASIGPYIMLLYGVTCSGWSCSWCYKTMYLAKDFTDSISISHTYDQSITAHLPYWNYPWLNYPCESSAPEACSGSDTIEFNKIFTWNSACGDNTYKLESFFAAKKTWNTTS